MTEELIFAEQTTGSEDAAAETAVKRRTAAVRPEDGAKRERDIGPKEDKIPVPIKFVQQLPMKKAAALMPAAAFGEPDFEVKPNIG